MTIRSGTAPTSPGLTIPVRIPPRSSQTPRSAPVSSAGTSERKPAIEAVEERMQRRATSEQRVRPQGRRRAGAAEPARALGEQRGLPRARGAVEEQHRPALAVVQAAGEQVQAALHERRPHPRPRARGGRGGLAGGAAAAAAARPATGPSARKRLPCGRISSTPSNSSAAAGDTQSSSSGSRASASSASRRASSSSGAEGEILQHEGEAEQGSALLPKAAEDLQRELGGVPGIGAAGGEQAPSRAPRHPGVPPDSRSRRPSSIPGRESPRRRTSWEWLQSAISR